MAKRTVRFLLPFLLGPALVLGPAAYMQADAAGLGNSEIKSVTESAEDDGSNAVTSAAEDIYEKASGAVDSIDGESVRQQIREALDKLDELGISPTRIAENTFGVRTDPGSGDNVGSKLAEDARDAVEKQSQNMFQSVWDRIMEDAADLAGAVIHSVEEAVSGRAGG